MNLLIFSCIASLLGAVYGSNRVAFIVPTHEPDFEYTLRFIDSHEQYNINADVIVVFSTPISMLAFQLNSYRERENVHLYVYDGDPELIAADVMFHKKWWTIYKHASKYDFFLPIDTECLFVQNYDVEFFVEYVFRLKHYYCAQSTMNYALQWSLVYFTEEEKKMLNFVLHDTTCITWFNEIPVVEKQSALRFIKHVNLFRKVSNLVWDFLPYANYMVLYEKWTFVDMSNLLSRRYVMSLGEGGGGNWDVVSRTKPHWAYWFAYEKEKEKFGSNVFLTFHHDRKKGVYQKAGNMRFYDCINATDCAL